MSCESVVGPDEREQIIAVCAVNGQDVGELFVRSGFGLVIADETMRYDEAQVEARAAGRGLWQGEFMPPAIWRSRPLAMRFNRPPFVPTVPLP